jgi:hypothetical protein
MTLLLSKFEIEGVIRNIQYSKFEKFNLYWIKIFEFEDFIDIS